jgi:hypothetical protein
MISHHWPNRAFACPLTADIRLSISPSSADLAACRTTTSYDARPKHCSARGGTRHWVPAGIAAQRAREHRRGTTSCITSGRHRGIRDGAGDHGWLEPTALRHLRSIASRGYQAITGTRAPRQETAGGSSTCVSSCRSHRGDGLARTRANGVPIAARQSIHQLDSPAAFDCWLQPSNCWLQPTSAPEHRRAGARWPADRIAGV